MHKMNAYVIELNVILICNNLIYNLVKLNAISKLSFPYRKYKITFSDVSLGHPRQLRLFDTDISKL